MRAAWLGVGLLAVVFALGCASNEEKVAQHVAAADELEAADDFRAALVELRSALSLEPKSADLSLRIGKVYAELGRPEAAFFYGEAYRLDPTLTEAALLQAPLLYSSDLDAAEALVDGVLEREPANVDAYVRRAELRLLRQDVDGALAAARTSVELGPNDIAARRIVTTVQRARIRAELLRKDTPDPEVFEAALAAADRAAEVSAGQEERLGPWKDRMEQALIYSDWPGHEAQTEASIREAMKLAEASQDTVGTRAVARTARRLAAATSNLEFQRWALERWVAAEPGAVQGWGQLASLAQQMGGSSDDVWARALAQSPEDLALHVGYVRALEAAGRREEAVEHVVSLPESLADSPELGALLVELYLNNGQAAEAKARLEDLQARHPDSPLTRLSAATFALEMGQAEQALKDLRVLAGQVERPDVLRQLAYAEARAGNSEAALAAVERSIELRPGRSVQAYRLRLRLLSQKQDWQGVLRSWRERRRYGLPADEASNLTRIRALYELGRAKAGRALLEATLTRKDVSKQAILLFYHYESVHQPERVRDLVLGAWEKDRADPALARAAMGLALAQHDPKKAIAVLEANAALTGRSADPIRQTRLLYATGRTEEAERLAREIFETRPRPFGASPLLVEILGARDKSDEAMAMLGAARAEGTLSPAGLWQLGRMHYELKEYEQALGPLEEAHAANPQFSPAISDLALVLAELGRDLERAVQLARQVKSKNPENAGIADVLGYVYLKKGLAEPAAFEFRSAIELAKLHGHEVAEYHYHLGLALQAQGLDAEAGRAFDDALRIDPDHQPAHQAHAG